LAIHPTNDFNKISLTPIGQLTVAQQNILMTMALNGDSIVNPFSDLLDAAGLTPEARTRKEREEEEHFRETMAQLEERRLEFQCELDCMDHACEEALRENEEHLHSAREDLKKIQDNAYQIHMPDGSIARVYRDGDKVRTESGKELGAGIVRAEDLGRARPTWQERVQAADRIDDLLAKREAIQKYRDEVQETERKGQSSGLSARDIDDLSRRRETTMPESVRSHYAGAASRDEPSANAEAPSGLARPFAQAASRDKDLKLSDRDFEELADRPAASMPAPR
jgi:hypothetical protein